MLRNPSTASDVEVQFDRQLLAAWLNLANGAVAWDELVDTDGDGLISAQELASLMRNLGDQTTDEQAADVVRAMDSDGDHRISLDEFARYMSQNQG